MRRSDEASLTAARYRDDLDRLSAATSWHIAGALAGAGSDGRKDNNNGVTARMRLHPKAGTSRASWAAGPILCAVCSQPFRPHTEPDPDA